MKQVVGALLVLVQSAFALGATQLPSLRQAEERLALMRCLGKPVEAVFYVDFARVRSDPLGEQMAILVEEWFEEYLDNETVKDGYLEFKRETGIEPFHRSNVLLMITLWRSLRDCP